MLKNNLYEVLLKELQSATSLQNRDGSFKAGHNGPYSDPETPIRNTAHYLFALSSMYEITGNQLFIKPGEMAARYLFDNKYIDRDGVYTCRTSEGKDVTNGVIGHAWVIEALLKAEKLTGVEGREASKRLWRLHEFSYDIGAWQKPKSENGERSFDQTFNHQLWFAACIAPLDIPEVHCQIKCFLQKNLSRLKTYRNGVIYHKSPVGAWSDWLAVDFKQSIRKILSLIKNPNLKRKMYLHSCGYHTFNLYALAMLKEAGYGSEIESLVDVSELLCSLRTKKLMEEIEKLPDIGIHYNPSGIEAAYALKSLGNDSDEQLIEEWLEFQIEKTQNEEGMLVLGSSDKATSAARLYEAIRLLY